MIAHSLALAGRSLTKTRRNPGVLMDALILPVLFLVLFVYLFGGAVAGSTQEYLQYLFPGILILTTVLAGQIATGMSIVVDMKKGVFDRFRSMPVSRSSLLVGSVLADSVRYVIAVVVLFGVGYLLGFRVETNAAAAAAAAGLAIAFGFALSWITVLVAVLLRDETMVSTVGFLLPFPLVFGTSMVAPAETMPDWLRTWADVNPVSHAIDASQGLLLGGPVAGPVAMMLLWGGVFLAVFGTAAVTAYRRLT
ncbi:ABC transporter permease [Isoptericola croceus]|uniref:ABC transporter permease n=1 Tax=Isoptericola croceus TaxID=3031406 RepID=UPI0023F665F1|nr:ABC transporter permease [Isoptericola croceus]